MIIDFMHDSTLDLFIDHENDKYWEELEAHAAELEVTMDYYLAEFCV